MFNLAVGELPDSWYQPIFLPILFLVIGAAVWYSGKNAELKNSALPWKWFAALPLFMALVSGWGPFIKMRDIFYTLAIAPFGKRMEMAHYAAFVLPLVAILGMAGWEFLDHRRSADDRR